MEKEGYVTQVDEAPASPSRIDDGSTRATEADEEEGSQGDGQTKAVVMMNIYCIANTL